MSQKKKTVVLRPGKKTVTIEETASTQNRLRIGIVVLTAVVYLVSLANGWTNWDDGDYILNNELVKTFNLSGIFSEYVAGNYHPVTVFFQSLEYQVFKLNATGFHTVSLLLHLFNSLLVFNFAILLTRNQIAAFISGLLFGIHPLHVESVAWISAQKDLLYGMFFLLALIQYMRYSEQEKRDWKKYLLVILLFVLSLLSKAQAVTLPVVLILIDWFRTKKISFRNQLDKIPFFAIAILFGLIAVAAQKQVHAIQDMTYFTWPERFLFSSYAITFYLEKLFVPLRLSTYYPYPVNGDGNYPAMVYIAPVIVLAVAAFIFYYRKKNPLLVFGSLFFLVNIALVLQLLPVGGAITADRYSYISFIGFFLPIGAAGSWVWKNRKEGNSGGFPLSAVVAGWLVFLVIAAISRTTVWKNSGTLFEDLVSKHDNVDIAFNNLGWYYMNENKLQLAKKNFDRALELHPGFVNAIINRYSVLKKLGLDDSALVDARSLIVLRPDLPDPYLDRGVAYGMAGKTDSALMDFRTAARLNPSSGEAYSNIGNVYYMKAMYDSSITNFLKAMNTDRTMTGIYNTLGYAYISAGDYQKSIDAFNNAIAENPADANNYFGRMQAYEKSGLFREAYEDALKSLELGATLPSEYMQQLRNKAGI